ncbi:MAG: RHS repeat domain-containing protein [Phycisphaerae bacterium]
MEESSTSNTPIRQYVWGTYPGAAALTRPSASTGFWQQNAGLGNVNIDECIQLTTLATLGPQSLPAGTYYLLQDLLYRAVALTNASGAIAEAYDTDAYGNTLIFTAPGADGVWFTDDDVQSSYGANEIIFCGCRYDPESELYYVRNRTYNPPLGRWLQRDPIGYAGGVNLYEYVGGRAVMETDPTGETCGVRFICQLASSGVDPLNQSERSCHYLCTEIGYPGDRVDQSGVGGGVTCTSLGRHPLVVTEDKTMYSPWGLWLLHCGNPPPCPANYMWQQWYSSVNPLPACSRSACRAGCSEVEAIADARCDFLEAPPAKAFCKALVRSAAAVCVSVCNAACKNP